MIDPTELRRLAEAAQHKTAPFVTTLYVTPEEYALHRALAPAAVLALLDRLAAAEARIGELEAALEPFAALSFYSTDGQRYHAAVDPRHVQAARDVLAVLRQPPAATKGAE